MGVEVLCQACPLRWLRQNVAPKNADRARLTSLPELKMRQSLSLVVVTAIDHRQGSNNGRDEERV